MATAPVRQRSRAFPATRDEDDVLPSTVVEYMRANFDCDNDGNPDLPGRDSRQMMEFMRRCFSHKAYKQHRHRVLDHLLRAGKTEAEIAVIFDAGQRTVRRWKMQMQEAIGESFLLQDVRDIHMRRMADIEDKLSVSDEIIHGQNDPTVKMQAMRTHVQLLAMQDRIYRQAGLYRAFNLDQLRPGHKGHMSDTNQAMLEDLDMVLFGEVPEH